MPEHCVAIDNVCAWPNLMRLPNGEIVATIFNQPCHGLWEGDVECWASEDGRFWQYRGTPALHDPGTNRMNVAAGLAHNGDLIVIASGWSHVGVKGEDKQSSAQSQVLPPMLCRSSDGGCSWSINRDVLQHVRLAGRSHLIPFGDVTRSPGGSLSVTFYSAAVGGPDQKDNAVHFVRSTDDGRTWSAPSTLAAAGHNETAVLHLGDGRWLAASRTVRTGEEQRGLDLFRSTDNGNTWSLQRPISLERQYPAHLLRLDDGRILLAYSSRCIGMFGIHARLSSDLGCTWSSPVALVHYEDYDSGYPSSVQRADGAIVTAYYHKCRPHHQRYHMGVMIWRLEEFFPNQS